MIQADGGDHHKLRLLDDVGGVQPPAHAGLQNDPLGRTRFTHHHEHEKCELEKRGVRYALPLQLLRRLPDRQKGLQKCSVVHTLPVETEPLVDAHQVGRREGRRFHPLLPENGL